MKTISASSIPFTRCLVSTALAAAGLAVAQAGDVGFGTPVFEWDLELTSMDLNVHNVLMPLGPDWDPILTDIHIGESSELLSKGKAFAYSDPGAGLGPPNPGDPMFVSSFFDVFFDVSLTDVDPGQSFGGGPDGLTVNFPNNGPAHMQNLYTGVYDPNAPNFGLIPPASTAPYIGHFSIEIPLGADLNGNGEDDKIKFTLVAHTVGDENRTFIILPDGSVIDNFDSTLDLSGAVVDLSQDPPFGPISLTGPSSVRSQLVPEPATTGAGAVIGLIGLTAWWRKRRSA